MSQAVLRIVKAPNQWHCECGNPIEPTQECAKMGSRILCLECLMSGLPARPLPKPLTKAQRLIREAQYLAWDTIADITHLAENGHDLMELLSTTINEVENEGGLRSMPYHGRAGSLFRGINGHQLDAMHSIYTEFHQSLLRENK